MDHLLNLTIGSRLPCTHRVMDAREVAEYEGNIKQLPNIISSNSVSPSPLKAYTIKLALKAYRGAFQRLHCVINMRLEDYKAH